ncbi:hypothetical protein PR202_ga14003 [Eleusine coracana subsp. coracana]|uniref:Calmodulin-binding protein n=1 Tax=Eleusine coracana subsp. coracana TaxID=191504 RepID=A0AAV5CFG0_ELECO|nr:hypothetical protein PR202_ga14003 [Eleusine coracana subsp. coracana]
MSQKRQPDESDGPRRGGGAESGGSSSSRPHRPGETKRQRVPALRDVITEVMWKTTIEKVIMAIEPLIRRVVKEEIESAFANHATVMASSSVTDTVPCTSKKLQLQFMTRLSLPIFTGAKIEGEGSLSITIALVDALTGQVVPSGKESLMKVEIVVLEGDFEGGEDWSAQEFDNNIIREREVRFPKHVYNKFDSFLVLGGGMSTKMWEVAVEHAKTGVLTDKVHYYYPNNLNKTGVVFNVVGEVRGLISDKFVLVDDLSETEKAEAHAAVKQAYEHWENVSTCDNETLVGNPLQLFNMRSPSLDENQYNQFSTQVVTDDFGLSDSTMPSADIFSMEPSSTLDPCSLETEEGNENQFQSELPAVGSHEVRQESQVLEKFSNSLVYDDSTNHPSFSDSYYSCVDPDISFDTQDLGAALKGFIATISKPKAYRGWRTLSYVLGWIFYTKKIVAQKRKKHGK